MWPTFCRLSRAVVVALAAAFAFMELPGRASDWPHWRGPHRNGHVDEPSGWRDGQWLPQAAAWEAQVGEGSTSPLLVGERVYVLGWANGHDTLHCLEAASGRPLWKQSYNSPRHARFATGDEGLYAGPTSTPEYDSATDYLYTLSSNGDLHCWNARDNGKSVWQLNLYDAYRVGQRSLIADAKDTPRSQQKIGRSGLRDYGYTTSPHVYGDWLLVEVGAETATLMAFDKRSGKQLWASQHAGPAGHSGGPVLMQVENVPCAAVFTLRELLVVRLDAGHEGQTAARYGWATAWANNILTPTVSGDCVLISSFHTYHAICKLKITLSGAKQLWQQPYASHVGSPLIVGDHVYMASVRLQCLEFGSGELKWEGGDFGRGGSCIATSDQRLVVFGGDGRLALVDTAGRSPGKYNELASRDRLLPSDAWPHAVLADGRLIVKDRAGNLKCFVVANRDAK